jgi:hypothetical protein
VAEFGDIYGLDDEVRSFISHLERSWLTVGDMQLPVIGSRASAREGGYIALPDLG